MSTLARREILVVDDDAAVRNSIGLVLKMAGYEVSLAENGFDALLQLRRAFPAVIISDLNMPQMSGFEFLSVVRRRFPGVPVIAMSGAYHYGDAVPGGVIADVFYAKGRSNPDELLKIVANLIQTSAARAVAHQKESAPVWIPRNGKDSHGIPYVVVTCTECLRSFPLSVVTEDLQKIQGCIDRLLGRTNIGRSEVDRIFLTGGSSLVPAVRRIFEEQFGAERISSGSEFTSVAKGLALRANAG